MIRIRHHAIGISDHPLAFRVAARGCVNSRDRDIDPVGIASGFTLESAKIETVAAACIENNVAVSGVDGLRDREALMLGKPAVV